MRIIKRKPLEIFWTKHPNAKRALIEWHDKTRKANWNSFVDIQTTFGQTDQASANSGHGVCVFDIGGNKFRLIAAVHFNIGIVYVLRVLTDPEYGTEKWKRDF